MMTLFENLTFFIKLFTFLSRDLKKNTVTVTIKVFRPELSGPDHR